MSDVLYEHPLNEKIRAFLRLEHFFTQLDCALTHANDDHYYPFFMALFECFDVIERSDIKTELGKELEIIEQNLILWSGYPNVDKDALVKTSSAITNTRKQLPSAYQQLQHIRNDPFLHTLRQRFSIPGGYCSYDLPNLHYWCQLNSDTRQRTIEQWLLPARLYQLALQSVMKFIRERDQFQSVTAFTGLYKDTADKTDLIRIKLPETARCYPSISGNKYRYAIRFMTLAADQQPSFVEEDIPFSLARC